MKTIRNLMLLSAGILLLITAACKKESGGTPAPMNPTISSVAPNSGPVGTTITITGTNLTGATVSFNGTAATPTSVSATEIKVNVPVGATTGDLVVTTSKGTAKFAFTVTAPTSPTISGVSPSSAEVGTAVTITGTNLTGATVSFNGTAATPTSVTATQIVVNVPTGATTGNITVTTANGSATFAFTVSTPAGPAVTAVTPNSATVGTEVVITGTNLTGATVSFNGTAAATTSNTATEIKVNVPAGATTGNITVTTANGAATVAFTVSAGPTSDDVAKEDLVAHFRFDDTKKEDSSGKTPSASSGTTTFVTGKIGKALQFTDAFMVYPVFDKFNNDLTLLANGFTISFWAQLPATSKFTSIVQLNGNIGDIFGIIQFAHRKNADPTQPGKSGLDFDGALTHVNGTGTHSTAFDAMLEGAGFLSAADEWIFVTMTYDDATRKITYYGNGTKYGSKDVSATVIPAGEKLEMLTTASNPGVSTNQFSFGALNTNPPFPVGPAPAGWQGTSLTGVLDDVRIFKKALTEIEIGQLYSRGSAGN